MSLFSSINTAVSGLTAQSTAFGNISEDVANSQTIGFKRVDTTFADYLTTSTPTQNQPGAVIARPDYVNSVQGTLGQTDNPLGMAISGNGFFAVSRPTSEANNVPVFNTLQYYSRAGDFTMNASGYLVNSAGDYLNGWPVNPTTNVVTQNSLQPIQVSQATLVPQETTSMTLAANLPATPTSGTATAASPLSSQITVYDSNGTAHSVNLNWSQATNATTGVVIPNQWNVQVMVPDAASTLGDGTTPNYTNAGSASVTFGNVASTLPPSGTINSITPVAGVQGPTVTHGTPATSSGTASDTFAVTAGATLQVVETIDNGSGSATGLTTTTTTYPAGSFTASTPVTSGSSGTIGETVTQTTAANGTITLVDANDDGTNTTTTTYTISPPRAALSGGGSYTASPGGAATLGFTTNFGSGNQTLSLNLGTFGGATGVTQYAGKTYSLIGSTQNGYAPGNFSGVTAQANGNVVITYDNGQKRTIAKVPLITFAAPDALQSQNGQAFTATVASGTPLAQTAGANGAGSIVAGSLEGSNVDIATEFSKLIVTQQAYSSNSKVVTTANQMLQVTLQMVA